MHQNEKNALHEFQALMALRRKDESKLIKLWAYLEERQVTSDLGFTSPHVFLVQCVKLTRRESYELTQLSQAYNRFPKIRPAIESGQYDKESLLRLKKIVEKKTDWTRAEREDFILKHMNKKSLEIVGLEEVREEKRDKFALFIQHTTIEEMNQLKSQRGIERGLDEFLSWLLELAKVEFSKRRFSSKKFQAILRRDQGVCQRCGSQHDLEVDHIHPKFLGGSDEPDNLRLLCRRCNVRAFKRCQPLLS